MNCHNSTSQDLHCHQDVVEAEWSGGVVVGHDDDDDETVMMMTTMTMLYLVISISLSHVL
jgi:hypothetical protein